MGFNSDLMLIGWTFDDDLMGLYSDLMDYKWDIASGNLPHS
jgi:hypothetical protein